MYSTSSTQKVYVSKRPRLNNEESLRLYEEKFSVFDRRLRSVSEDKGGCVSTRELDNTQDKRKIRIASYLKSKVSFQDNLSRVQGGNCLPRG